MLTKRFGLVIALVMVFALILTACAQPTAAPTEAPAEPEAPAAAGTKIVYIPKNTGNPYFDSITGGFEDACASLGCEFEFVAPARAEATSQIPFIEAQIQRGVEVIAIAPNSPDALNQVLRQAQDAGIVVLTVNGDITGSEEYRDAAEESAAWHIRYPSIGM